MRRLALCLLVLSLGATAQPPVPRRVTFHLRPQNATVWMLDESGDYNYLGQADQAISLDLHGRSSQFRFQAEGWKTSHKVIENGVLRDYDQWPENGQPFLLEPESRWVLIGYLLRPWRWALAVVGVLGIAGLGRWRRRAQRMGKLESLAIKSSSEGDLVGARLGNYRLTDRLGRGGMATVYRAIPDGSLSEEQAVAIKLIETDEADRDEGLDRFRREVRAYQSLNHPNIVRLIEWVDDQEPYYIVMELLEGGTLEKMVREGAPPAKAVAVLDEVMRGVAHAHYEGIIHRDLKPGNVMFTAKGKPKVMDFGLARGHFLKTVTVTGTVLGTPAYMAPEQIQGLPPSPSMDQYALGIVAYQLLAGRLPFDGDDMMGVVTAHLVSQPPPLRQFKPELPASLEAVVLKMLAKDPSDRFAGVEDARQALLAAARDLPREQA
ncbi:MAG: serine/threonine protein kinase [Candidatus Eremiobacteraeota bacterium]|nr:serine/threonine protein kinase [Candidatus Eremiobacteraeota bacterium]